MGQPLAITKDLIKTEVDKVQEEYLEVLYRVVKALEEPPREAPYPEAKAAWESFVAETYGSFADDPISRGGQGDYEAREPAN
ncbi:MAG TPA: hypothetical protein VOA87_16390 [Thermoanaerobaculia bacterium]|nr:hypothetical protein [Thermoanaerobaculia bacterium]